MTDSSHILTHSDEQAISEGCYFDEAKAEKAIDWIERTFSVRLYVWQAQILCRYFGWRRADGGYRFTKLYVWIPKKNGKSFFIAALLAYKLFELRDGRIYSAAVNAKQAGIILDQAIRLLKGSPAIKRMMKPRTGKVRAFNTPFRREIICDVTGSRYLSLSDTPDAADGLIPDVIALDELHRMKNGTIDILEGGATNNPDAMRVIISTAGSGDKTHRSWERYEYTKKVLTGEVIDVQLLPVIFECPDAEALKGADIYDLDRLVACNPVLQEDEAKREQARKEVDEARILRNDAWWRRFRLGQWLTTDGEEYIPAAAYDACRIDPLPEPDLAGAECFVGLDKSDGAWDLTAATLLLRLPDGGLYERHLTFAYADRLKDMSERDDRDYQKDVESGELIAIPENAISDEWIFGFISDAMRPYQVKQIAADPHAAAYLLERWKAEGCDVVAVQQNNNRLLTPVIEDYANRVRQRRIVHAHNAIVDWQLSCARVFTTAKDTKKIVKAGTTAAGRGGTGHIDNVDSLLNALAALRAAEIVTAAYGNSGIVFA
jgi:phage terminase large subunit-like protein